MKQTWYDVVRDLFWAALYEVEAWPVSAGITVGVLLFLALL